MTAPAPGTEAEAGRLVRAASLDEIPPGWVLKVKVENRELALANVGGTVRALDNACTHAGGPLGDNRLHEGCFLECPWHNTVFDARTGEVVRGPARKAVKSYEVTVLEGSVYVSVD
ncbi:MAG: Rieske (2Fe-2S) protein [Actinomycetota bacterium]